MNVLVVGGAGFIGHNVVQKFISEGHTVSILDSMTGYQTYEPKLHDAKLNQRMLMMPTATLYHGDLTGAAFENAFRNAQPEIVINLANVPVAGIAAKYPLMASEAMIAGLLRLLERSANDGVKRFVNISSSMVYGDFSFDPQPESAGCHPKDLYGNLKLAGERLVRSYTHSHGMNHTIVRPSAVYGPSGNEMFVVTRFLRAAMDGGTINIQGKDVALDFTYVSDIAEGIYLAATQETGINETFNITTGEKRSLYDVAKFFRSRYPDVTVNITDPDPLYPKRGTLDINKAKMLLGYRPEVHLEVGLSHFLSDVKRNGL